MNVVIKCLYVFVNLIALFILNSSLDNHFLSYGTDWVHWKALKASLQMDFEERTEPTPGNRMLPTFGMCDITDSRLDNTNDYANKVKVICEVSTHILYHYVFLFLWFVLFVSLIISCFGVILYILGHLKNMKYSRKKNSPQIIYKQLTMRECEYLEFIRRRDLTMYGAVVKKLHSMRSPYNNNNGHYEDENDDELKMVSITETW